MSVYELCQFSGLGSITVCTLLYNDVVAYLLSTYVPVRMSCYGTERVFSKSHEPKASKCDTGLSFTYGLQRDNVI